MNYGSVMWFVGSILRVVGYASLASVIVSLVFAEWFGVIAFILCFFGFYVCSVVFRTIGSEEEPSMSDSMMVATLSWLITGIIGSIPFFVVAWLVNFQVEILATPQMNQTVSVFLNPLNGIFESVSGFTGTGLTYSKTEQNLPRSLQWWRSLTEWVGGVGVIILTVAVLSRPGSGSLTLYNSEARDEKILPSVTSTVKEIWKIYIGLTLSSILLFLIVGMKPWGAINHAMAGIATGGFSIYADSIGHYGSPLIEYATIPVMMAGSIAFPVHYLILKGEIRNFYEDVQTRWLLSWIAVGSIVLIVLLSSSDQYSSFEETVRVALFQFVSATTNAGFGTATIGGGATTVWSTIAILFTCAGMLTGGASGSTTSGIKMIRVYISIKGTVWQIASVFEPKFLVRNFYIGDRKLTESAFNREYKESTVIILLWIMVLIVSTFILTATLPEAIPLENIIFEIFSAQNNVGLSTGIVRPDNPLVPKLLFIFIMLAGRLEIIPVAVAIAGVLRSRSI